MRRGAPNCIRMNPRSRCASGMLGSSSTVYNEQPTSAEMLPSRARTEIGYEANIQQFDQNPTYKRVCRAHPRAYREHIRRLCGDLCMGSSSPRIRGKHRGGNLHKFLMGLIPTHTGKASRYTRLRTSSRAHPRTYGERNYERQTVTPHAWLTPAHTGNILQERRHLPGHAAHPRVYREYQSLSSFRLLTHGSSPCIQGIHLATRHDTQPKTRKYSVSTRIHI